MKKKLSALDITFVVLGILSIVYGILYYFDIGRTLLGVEIGSLVNGILVIIVAVLLLLDKIRAKSSGNKRLIFALVFALWVLVGLFAFILPAFEGTQSSNISLWIGTLLVVYSIVLVIFEKPKDLILFVYLLLTAFGGYLIGSNLLNQFVLLTIVIVFVLFGIFALFKGLLKERKGK